jgi:rubrerythrin
MNNQTNNHPSCTGKEVHTRGEARKAASRMNANRYNKKGLPPIKAYQCVVCGHWHLGNPHRNVKRKNS